VSGGILEDRGRGGWLLKEKVQKNLPKLITPKAFGRGKVRVRLEKKKGEARGRNRARKTGRKAGTEGF